jgi:hypothetical protein
LRALFWTFENVLPFRRGYFHSALDCVKSEASKILCMKVASVEKQRKLETSIGMQTSNCLKNLKLDKSFQGDCKHLTSLLTWEFYVFTVLTVSNCCRSTSLFSGSILKSLIRIEVATFQRSASDAQKSWPQKSSRDNTHTHIYIHILLIIQIPKGPEIK